MTVLWQTTQTSDGVTIRRRVQQQWRLRELPDGIRREVGDATDPVTAKSLIDRIAAEAGPPEVLVNTIGTFRLGEALAGGFQIRCTGNDHDPPYSRLGPSARPSI